MIGAIAFLLTAYIPDPIPVADEAIFGLLSQELIVVDIIIIAIVWLFLGIPPQGLLA